MSEVRVRRANAADSAAIGALHVAAWRETYAGLLSQAEIEAMSVAARTAQWRAQISAGTARGVYVAEEQDGIIGFGACTSERDPALVAAGYTGEVPALYILRRGQGRGTGRLLMRAMARRLIAEGDRNMALWVLSTNTPARAFYERLGGKIVTERGTGHDAETAYGWRDLSALTISEDSD
ncbi:MAG: GNAT family N-acetyltransferase [Sphingomonas sp.]|nr:GNAT family N-acetyltransferase [Sphingomonas sp.]